MCSSYGSKYNTCLAFYVTRTLRRSVLEPIPQPRYAAARMLCKVIGTRRRIFIKEVGGFLT